MNQTIGTCSICGGRVTVPSIWLAVIPPTPTCENCGATAAPNNGPVIPMVPHQTPPMTKVWQHGGKGDMVTSVSQPGENPVGVMLSFFDGLFR